MGCIKLDILENHYKTPELKIVHAKKELTSKKSSSEGRNYYHARYFDPRTSVWQSVDPMTESRAGLSPYNYCSNNPIMRTDPTGALDTKYVTEDGTKLVETQDGSNAVVTVTDEQGEAFHNDYKNASNEEVNSKEWNYKWKSNLSGVAWNDYIENNQSYWATEEARRNAFRYLQTGNFDYWRSAVADHTASFRDPVSMFMGAVGFAYGASIARLSYAAKGVGKQLGFSPSWLPNRTITGNLDNPKGLLGVYNRQLPDGTWVSDTKNALESIGDFPIANNSNFRTISKDGYKMLNTPKEFHQNADQFWTQYI